MGCRLQDQQERERGRGRGGGERRRERKREKEREGGRGGRERGRGRREGERGEKERGGEGEVGRERGRGKVGEREGEGGREKQTNIRADNYKNRRISPSRLALYLENSQPCDTSDLEHPLNATFNPLKCQASLETFPPKNLCSRTPSLSIPSSDYDISNRMFSREHSNRRFITSHLKGLKAIAEARQTVTT